MRGGFPVQGVREAELGDDFELVLRLSGEPRRLLELKQGAVGLAAAAAVLSHTLGRQT